MSDWVASWVDNPSPATPGTRAEIVLRDGSMVRHTVARGEDIRHDAVGVWLTVAVGEGRGRQVRRRVYVWHDVAYFGLTLVSELKISSPTPSVYGNRTEWLVFEEPTALRFWNLDGRDPVDITVMDHEPVTAGVASLGGPPVEVVALARTECGR